MKKRAPLLYGLLIGVLIGIGFSCAVAAWLAVQSALTASDPRYDLVAVSWGGHTNSESLLIYQAQVEAKPSTKKGSFDILARVCIGGGNYFHDLGNIGTASDMGDAIERFGVITWLPDKLTVGGTDGVKATLMRSELQIHR